MYIHKNSFFSQTNPSDRTRGLDRGFFVSYSSLSSETLLQLLVSQTQTGALHPEGVSEMVKLQMTIWRM
jgi:hypothetical protein